jgi:hypothetical protein
MLVVRNALLLLVPVIAIAYGYIRFRLDHTPEKRIGDRTERAAYRGLGALNGSLGIWMLVAWVAGKVGLTPDIGIATLLVGLVLIATGAILPTAMKRIYPGGISWSHIWSHWVS